MVNKGNPNRINLRNDAVPAVTLSRAKVEYCWRARARCTAAVSSAEMLRTFTAIGKRDKKIISFCFGTIQVRNGGEVMWMDESAIDLDGFYVLLVTS